MVAWTNTKYAWSYEKQFHHYTKGKNPNQTKQTNYQREIEDSTIKNNYFQPSKTTGTLSPPTAPLPNTSVLPVSKHATFFFFPSSTEITRKQLKKRALTSHSYERTDTVEAKCYSGRGGTRMDIAVVLYTCFCPLNKSSSLRLWARSMQKNQRLLQQCTIVRTRKHVQTRKNMYILWFLLLFLHFFPNSCWTTVFTWGWAGP